MQIKNATDLLSWLQNAEHLDSEIIYNRDFDYDYFGFKVRCRKLVCVPGHIIARSLTGHINGVQTLERSYLLRINDTVVERPQHMLMRVAVGIHKQVCHLASIGGPFTFLQPYQFMVSMTSGVSSGCLVSRT